MTQTFLSKIKNTYKNGGVAVVAKKVLTFPFIFVWRTSKHAKKWVFGKLFEVVRGNKITYKGIVLSFDDPYIQTKEKGHMLFGMDSCEESAILFTEKYTDKNLPFIELGGCTGVVACITDRMISTPHIVVEANPCVIPLLEKNKKTNNCHFTIINKAIGYTDTVDYYVSTNPVDGGLYKHTSRKISVPAITLAELAKDFEKINLLVDIEGAEIDLIDHEIDCLAQKVAVFIIEFHPALTGEHEVDRVTSHLEKAGFICKEKNENDVVFVNARLIL